MEKIVKKIEELEKLLNDYKPQKNEGRKVKLITSYIKLAKQAATFKSRVVVNNYKPKTEEPKEQPKAKRGRPKKKENKNVLATSAAPKTLKDKLENE
jgi:hypothetical protein